jgi:hypothetical protein
MQKMHIAPDSDPAFPEHGFDRRSPGMQPGGQNTILIYQASDGRTRLDVHLDHETVWLTQKQMSELFDKTVPTINEHIKNIFKEGELDEEAVVRNFRITAADGKTYETNHYNLDVIISVGYRVKSRRGTQFRQSATRVLLERARNDVGAIHESPSRARQKQNRAIHESPLQLKAHT